MTTNVRCIAIVVALTVAGCHSPTPVYDDADVSEAGADTSSAPDATWMDPCRGVTSPFVQTVAMLSTGRYAPAVAALPDGRILIAGGFDFTAGITATAEIYDPHARTVTPTGSMFNARNFASTTVVENGVLVIGGFDNVTGSVGFIERYDWTTGTWIASSTTLVNGREAHTATLLGDGRVLVAGGLQARGLHFQSSLEIYDPVADTLRTSSSMLFPPRGFHDAVWLETRGAVLIAGGDSGTGELATAVRWGAGSDVIDPTHSARAHAGKAVAAGVLPNGHVIVTGGANATDGTLADVDDFDPSTDRFTPAPPMTTRRMAHTLTRLGDGRMVAIGGWSDSGPMPAATGSIDVRGTDGTWTRHPLDLVVPRLDHRAIALDDCHIIVIGGQHAATGAMPSAPREVELVTIPR